LFCCPLALTAFPTRRSSDLGVAKVLAGGDGQRESLMQIEVDRQSGKAALEMIAQHLESVLADARAAVEDWRPMCARLAETIADLDRKSTRLNSSHVKISYAV